MSDAPQDMSGNVTNPGQNGYLQATDLAVHVDNVSNPDGPLAGPLAAQDGLRCI